jgi:superfamily II DNA or RNA helicase
MDSLKEKVQEEALARWKQAGHKGTLAMSTGTGKSRIPLIRLEELYEEYGENLRILLAVFTEEARDVTWPDEAKAWNLGQVYLEVVEGVCYASLAKQPTGHYHLVILDEAHHITEVNSKFLENITYNEIIGLTATAPEKGTEKAALLNKIAPVVFSFSLDEAVDTGVSADYEIVIIEMPLDDTVKVIPGGNKKNRFKTTEKKAYDYLNRQLMMMLMSDRENKEDLVSSFFRKRARFITNLPSKTTIARKILKKIFADNKTLVFGGSIQQIEELLGPYTYHSMTDRVALEYFMKDTIEILGAVNALNESVNIPGVTQILVIQLNSKERDIKQRVGRILRKREGHKARVYILVVTGTVDEEWANKALEGFDKTKIVYDSYKNYL